MSNTDQWQKRLERHRYSQDDRMLSYKYQKELEPVVNKFLDESKEKVLVVGVFDLTREPWRRLAINEFRKFGLKVMEKNVNEVIIESKENKEALVNKTELSLIKLKLTRI